MCKLQCAGTTDEDAAGVGEKLCIELHAFLGGRERKGQKMTLHKYRKKEEGGREGQGKKGKEEGRKRKEREREK